MTKAIEEVYSSLKGQFRGDLIRPGDDDYETAPRYLERNGSPQTWPHRLLRRCP